MSKSIQKKVAEKVTEKATTPFHSENAKACFEHFEPMARAVPEEGLEPFRLNIDVVRVNVLRGVEAIVPHVETIRRKLPECAVHEILEVHEVALGLLVAANKVIPQVSDGEIDARLSALRPLREAGLRQLEVFSLLGKLDKKVPAKIRKGKGSLDAAQDAVAIAAAFHDHQKALAGQHPFSPELLDKMSEDGTWLVKALKPKNAAKGVSTGRDPAAILRDQFGALLTSRYEELQHAGVVVFGLKNLEDHIPALGARAAATRGEPESDATPPAAPVPAPAPQDK
ncbi:MAG: hypothetical protein U0441_34205 [Polyangiaceae bacterium]